MVELVLTRKHRVTVDKLPHDASHCPNINLPGVGRTHQQFRRTVPSGCHVISQFLFLFLELPGKAEITDFELFFVGNEQVLGFDVPVDGPEGVHIGKPFQQLVHVESNEFGFESVGRFFQHFKQVILDVLKHQVDNAFFAKGLLQLHHGGVFQHFE